MKLVLLGQLDFLVHLGSLLREVLVGRESPQSQGRLIPQYTFYRTRQGTGRIPLNFEGKISCKTKEFSNMAHRIDLDPYGTRERAKGKGIFFLVD